LDNICLKSENFIERWHSIESDDRLNDKPVSIDQVQIIHGMGENKDSEHVKSSEYDSENSEFFTGLEYDDTSDHAKAMI